MINDSISVAFNAGLPLPPTTEPHLLGALRHTLDHPGSLVRARLVYQMARCHGLLDTDAQQLAIAIEYFHTASLLFDDLPCMDDATHRRGALCAHKVYGEAAAILAALGLINRAYASLWHVIAVVPVERQAGITAYVEKCLGVDGLLNGQSQDLHFTSRSRDAHPSQQVALGKTVSLIRLSFVLPALIGSANAGEVLLLERLAAFWGFSYQILDDLKDVCQTPDQTGKTSARDASLQRPNLALAIGVDKSLQRLQRFMRLGDLALKRLLRRAPALAFLEELRARFQRELAEFRAVHPSLV